MVTLYKNDNVVTTTEGQTTMKHIQKHSFFLMVMIQ